MVGRVVVMPRVALVVVPVGIAVTVAVMGRVRLAGVAMGFGEEMHREPGDVEHQQQHGEPAQPGGAALRERKQLGWQRHAGGTVV